MQDETRLAELLAITLHDNGNEAGAGSREDAKPHNRRRRHQTFDLLLETCHVLQDTFGSFCQKRSHFRQPDTARNTFYERRAYLAFKQRHLLGNRGLGEKKLGAGRSKGAFLCDNTENS